MSDTLPPTPEDSRPGSEPVGSDVPSTPPTPPPPPVAPPAPVQWTPQPPDAPSAPVEPGSEPDTEPTVVLPQPPVEPGTEPTVVLPHATPVEPGTEPTVVLPHATPVATVGQSDLAEPNTAPTLALGNVGELPPPSYPVAADNAWAAPAAATATATATRTPTQRKPLTTWAVVLIALLVGLVAGGGAGFAASAVYNNNTATNSVSDALGQIKGDTSPRASNSVAAIAKAVSPSVVTINASGSQQAGTGSGFVIRPDGYILTNNHVVEPAVGGGTLTVKFVTGQSLPATIVGRSPSYDLAVIKVAQTNLPAVQLGNSSTVQVGDAAIAFGAPLGLSGTVTSGIISAVHRPVTAGGSGEQSYINALQTDAAINPGNSGGPLVNGAGLVIGINSSIATLDGSSTTQSGSIGLGFAIPINTAKRIADELILHGKAETPIIGVSLSQNYTGEGVQIATVTPGGPADKAGIKKGDVILKVDGTAVTTPSELIVNIRDHQPGDVVTLTVKNSTGTTTDVKVTLGTLPSK